MPQIKDLDLEKTLPIDADYVALDDSADSWKSKKVKFSSIWNYIIGKFTATASEINSVCSGNTATGAEITQICDGRVAGGTSSGDLLTVSGAQAVQYKNIKLSGFNDDPTVMACTSTQLNTLQYTTGTGRVNEVQQGLAVGNTTITAAGSFAYHGLVNINLSSTNSITFGPLSSYNVSEIVALKNISATTSVTVNRAGSDRFFQGGTGYTSFILTAGESVALMAMGSNKWLVLGYSTVTFS